MAQIEIKLTVKLDAVPGWGYQAQDYLTLLNSPTGPIPPWYLKGVELLVSEHEFSPVFGTDDWDNPTCRICMKPESYVWHILRTREAI